MGTVYRTVNRTVNSALSLVRAPPGGQQSKTLLLKTHHRLITPYLPTPLLSISIYHHFVKQKSSLCLKGTTTTTTAMAALSPPRTVHTTKTTTGATAATSTIELSSSGSTHSSSSSPNNTNSPPHCNSPPRIKKPTNSNTPNRSRINSRDFVRSYSGLYGDENDLLPYEINRKHHTEWLESKIILLTYIAGIALFQIVVTALLDGEVTGIFQKFEVSWSWTITNACHALLSTIYLHWLKGSIFDNQGEMAALTLWEQLEGRRNTSTVKRVLTLVPTLLCYCACSFSNYEYHVCIINCLLYFIQVLGKLPIMNGVRIFGINRTSGIDDNINISDKNVDDDKDNDNNKNAGGDSDSDDDANNMNKKNK